MLVEVGWSRGLSPTGDHRGWFQQPGLACWVCSGRACVPGHDVSPPVLRQERDPPYQQATCRAWLNLGNFAWSSMELHKRGVLSLVPRQWEQGEVGLKEISAALRFPSKYLIREMFDFNNK